MSYSKQLPCPDLEEDIVNSTGGALKASPNNALQRTGARAARPGR